MTSVPYLPSTVVEVALLLSLIHILLDPATGKYHYELDNSKIQEWNSEGSNAKSDTEQFTIQVTVNGTTVDKVINVTVNGANDRPKWMDGVDDFTGVAKPFVKDADHKDDNADMRFEGTVSGGTDIDDSSVQYMLTDGSTQANGDFSTSAVIKTDYGSFTIDPVTGEYTYTCLLYTSTGKLPAGKERGGTGNEVMK